MPQPDITPLPPVVRGLPRLGAGLPLEIRGFGHIKDKNLQHTKAKETDLLARFRSTPVKVCP